MPDFIDNMYRKLVKPTLVCNIVRTRTNTRKKSRMVIVINCSILVKNCHMRYVVRNGQCCTNKLLKHIRIKFGVSRSTSLYLIDTMGRCIVDTSSFFGCNPVKLALHTDRTFGGNDLMDVDSLSDRESEADLSEDDSICSSEDDGLSLANPNVDPQRKKRRSQNKTMVTALYPALAPGVVVLPANPIFWSYLLIIGGNTTSSICYMVHIYGIHGFQDEKFRKINANTDFVFRPRGGHFYR